MSENLKKWQRSLIRNNMEKYREAHEEYIVKNKPCFVNAAGEKIFSLLSPPFSSPVARRRVRRILDDILDRNTTVEEAGQTQWARRTPHVITFAVTYECQCDCSHCSAYEYRKNMKQKPNTLTSTEIRKTISDAVDIGTTCVVLTGGEPLLVKEIHDLIAGVDKKKSICTLFTNGALLDEPTVSRLKEAGTYGVYVSLDFSDPTEHDRNRSTPGLFKHAVQGISWLQKAGIPAGISTFASKEKLACGEIDRYMDLAKDLGVLEVFLFDRIPTGRLENESDSGLTLSDNRRLNEIREAYKKKADYPRIIHQTMFASMAYPCQSEGCPAGMVTLHVRANGDVSPCDFTPLSFGNVREKSLGEIWRSLTEHPVYSVPAKTCRFMDPKFRDFLTTEKVQTI